jgi:predicted component of type VI protein secretion system
MPLTLTILSCPASVTPETRTISGGKYTVGRGPGVDWVLPDPGQTISRRHFTVAYRSGGWRISDESSNGTFLNRDNAPVGQGNDRNLRDNDHLRFGPYEIKVALKDDSPRISFARRYLGRRAAGQVDPDGSLRGSPRPLSNPAAGLRAGHEAPFHERPHENHPAAMNGAMQPPKQTGQMPASPLPVAPTEPSLLDAFLTGIGLPEARPLDPTATMHLIGEAFRAFVSGLREVLVARASIKSEFRIEQTMFQARGNNPLKFSADDDDAITALLGVGRRIGIPPAVAIGDALRDIRLHELASIAAMQSAMRALLAGLDPEEIRAKVEQAGGLTLLPAQKKARAWEAYEALHQQTVQTLGDDFDSVFGKAFARAYEEALQDLNSRERSEGAGQLPP